MSEIDIKIKVDAELIKILFPFAGVNDIRYYLNGFHIQKHKDGGVIIQATNGHVLGAILDTCGSIEGADEAIIKVEKSALSKLKSGDFITVQKDSLSVHWVSGLKKFIQPGSAIINGKFPGTEHFTKDKKFIRGLPGSYNPEYLKLAASTLVGGRYQGISFFYREDIENPQDSPIYFRSGSLPGFYGIIMPLRDSIEEALPDWVKK